MDAGPLLAMMKMMAGIASADEGKTWKWKRTLENNQKGSGRFSYPCLIQTNDGLLHITYSYSLEKGAESIKYTEIDPKSIN